MHTQSFVMMAVCGFMLVYLFYALLRPEKF
jgi:K+-transporting ATPase KdpF subunit